MKMLKKLFAFVFSVILCALITNLPVQAASNGGAILAALRSGVNVNGAVVTLPANYINQAENYLASHEITDKQASYILAEINGAKSAIKEAGVTNLKDIDKATKEKVLAAAQAAANEINLKMTIAADKHVKVADTKGAIIFDDNNVIKTTGASFNYRALISLSFLMIVPIGSCLFVIKREHLLDEYGANIHE